MAVETKYVVVRKGEEKMTFANKKDADAWDKMLDMADAFTDWLLQNNPEMDESQAEALGLQLAEQKDAVQHILRTSKLPEPVNAEESASAETAEADDAGEVAADAPEKKVRAVKVA
ncbi:YebG family protein [Pantoea sp.]|uniref:YebG family protein n=1 Tax=Pantoea sp. TaxID=69393 RepID=UPI0028A94AE8|nr:YebG family protein [Pantoea sp.]